jgi:hypothetical protein
MQLYEILCVLETNNVAISLYMTSAYAMVRYHGAMGLGLVRIWFRKSSGFETLTMSKILP